jgi:DNA-binding transcriptional regulator YhcF (GntR family)
MRAVLNESEPIFQQIADMIIEDIIDEQLKADEQIPSENEISQFFGINRATVRNGLQVLIDMDLVYKKRGIGMFVKEDARKKLLNEKRATFIESYIRPVLKEGKRLGLSMEDIIKLIKEEDNK